MSEICFNIYLFTQYSKIPFQHVVNIKNINEICLIFLSYQVFEMQCAFYTHNTSWCAVAMSG